MNFPLCLLLKGAHSNPNTRNKSIQNWFLTFSDDLQGHDGGTLSIGQWVAVAYNEGFYIGQITSINFRLLDSAEEVDVKFLTKSKAGETYKWPKRKDTDNVSTTYIFCSTPIVQKVGTNFVLSNKNNIAKQYDSYKKTYMIQ